MRGNNWQYTGLAIVGKAERLSGLGSTASATRRNPVGATATTAECTTSRSIRTLETTTASGRALEAATATTGTTTGIVERTWNTALFNVDLVSTNGVGIGIYSSLEPAERLVLNKCGILICISKCFN